VKPFFSIRNLSLYCLATTAISSFYPLAAHAVPVPTIDNQATGTYEDPKFPKKPLTVLSEKVTIALQEVAGIVINPKGITGTDGNPISNPVKDTVLFYNFEVQNIGTDTTQFFIPNLATVGNLGTFQKVQYLDGSIWKDVPATGLISAPIALNGKLPVRVIVKVNNGVGEIPVSLGNAPGQNQPRSPQANDVYTVDAANGTPGEFDGSPINGVREAQATQTFKIGAQPEALTRIDLKMDSPFDPYTNKIGFSLALQVLDRLPPNFSNISPTDLTGRQISLDGRNQTGILISDAIPLGTKFAAATSPNPDWIPVYYYSDVPIGPSDRADNLLWSITPPDASTANQVRRVGFFRRNYRMPKGTAISGFRIEVEVTNFSLPKIYNIAQVFGSNPADPNSTSDTTPGPRLAFDESGDTLPNNYNYDGTPGTSDSNGIPLVYPGIIDAKTPDSDPRSPVFINEAKGSSSQTSADGEYIVVPFVAPAPATLKNGPRDRPLAIGSTNDNDDFTNKSTPLNGSDNFDPAVLPFVNTVINTSDLTRDIEVVPQIAQPTDLPEGTIITLKDPTDETRTATFKYQNGSFVPVTGSPSSLVLKGVAANKTKNYSVFVDLPANTPVMGIYPVKLVAFVDSNGNDRPEVTESQNATIDRTYTGFMQVIKESRVLAFDLAPLPAPNGVFSPSTKPVKLDQYIEYRITYRNISTPAVGSGNRTISATNFTLIEDGRVNPNNWASQTLNDPSSAASSAPSAITYSTTTGTSVTTDLNIVKYENVLTTPVDPGQSGTFSFRRRVK
jgi:hypothetical protein